MKAMILAAGLGTRLRPLTNDRPKALVEVAGRTLLEIALTRLRAFGICEVIINVHHFADKVVDYLKANSNFGIRIEISREEVLLDTGGGLKKAGWFFLENSKSPNSHGQDDPFVLHNVDVLSTIDLDRMTKFHKENHALATLAVQERKTSRYLLFDPKGELCGRCTGRDQPPGISMPSQRTRALAFSGIHIISPHLLPLMTEQGAFSIIDSYIRLAAQGEKILAYPADEYYWRDLGRLENIPQAAQDLKRVFQ